MEVGRWYDGGVKVFCLLFCLLVALPAWAGEAVMGVDMERSGLVKRWGDEYEVRLSVRKLKPARGEPPLYRYEAKVLWKGKPLDLARKGAGVPVLPVELYFSAKAGDGDSVLFFPERTQQQLAKGCYLAVSYVGPGELEGLDFTMAYEGRQGALIFAVKGRQAAAALVGEVP